MVSLNRAIAVAMVHGPAAGLELLDQLGSDGRMAGHYRLDAVRAHLLEKSGDHQAAIARLQSGGGSNDEHPRAGLLDRSSCAVDNCGSRFWVLGAGFWFELQVLGSNAPRTQNREPRTGTQNPEPET